MDSGKGSEYITKLDAFEDLSSASSLAFSLKGCQRQRSSDTVPIKNSSFLLLPPPPFFSCTTCRLPQCGVSIYPAQAVRCMRLGLSLRTALEYQDPNLC